MSIPGIAQPDSTQTNFKLTIFADMFYAQDFEKFGNEILYPFLYNYNRNRSLNLNHSWIRFSTASRKIRTSIALQAGTYVQDNYASEPGWAKAILEANLGIALNQQSTLWLDAGVFPSYIGFESAGSMENWTLTRSVIAENSPYYLNGVKLVWRTKKKWELSLLSFNGWQRIYANGKFLPALGWQVKHQADKTLLNWSFYCGNVEDEAVKRVRIFNNFYLQTNLFEKLALIADLDWGRQQADQGYDDWWGAALIMRMEFNTMFSTAFRAEYYYDPSGFVTAPVNVTTSSFSLNLDYKPIPVLLLRAELRKLIGNKSQNIDIQSGSYFTVSALSRVDLLNRSK